MCRILFGTEALERHCVILGNVNVNSPLGYDGTVSRVIRTYAVDEALQAYINQVKASREDRWY